MHHPDVRKSYIELNQVYFWTATINNWQTLLEADDFKEVIIKSHGQGFVSSRDFFS